MILSKALTIIGMFCNKSITTPPLLTYVTNPQNKAADS